jgi:nucleoside-diphosphate-sugar epimerase
LKRISEEDLLHVLKHTESIMDALKNKNIFITGATGFFGKWLLESFLFINKHFSLNATVTALSRDPEAFLEQCPFYKTEPAIVFIKGDVQSFDFPDGEFQFIIHAATDADAQLNNSNPLLMLDTIINGIKRVLEFAKKQPVESFLLTSSGAVYGRQPNQIKKVKETDYYHVNLDFDDMTYAYAEGKRMSELYCSLYFKQHSLPVKIARCFAFVGPYLPLDKHFAIGNFILNGLNNEDFIIKGDGSPMRSYLYASDLTIWLWTILLSGKINTAYNVGSGHAINIRETAELVANNFGNNTNVNVLLKPSNLPPQQYVPDISKAQSELNLNVMIDINQAIINTINFYN